MVTLSRPKTTRFKSPLLPPRSSGTWPTRPGFFEEFILTKLPGYERFHPEYNILSLTVTTTSKVTGWPNTVGGLSRPYLADIFAYREHVDRAVEKYFPRIQTDFGELLVLGLQHEEQHQELILMDIKYLLGTNPLRSAYTLRSWSQGLYSPHLTWLTLPRGTYQIGHLADDSFGFDNEYPEHARILSAAQVASRNVLNGEYLEFVEGGGLQRPQILDQRRLGVGTKRAYPPPAVLELGARSVVRVHVLRPPTAASRARRDARESTRSPGLREVARSASPHRVRTRNSP